MSHRWFEFVEMPPFTRKLEQIAGRDTLQAIQSDLIKDPERWPIVQGTNGTRKRRVADSASSHGKSGSFRYYYVFCHGEGGFICWLSWKERGSGSKSRAKEEGSCCCGCNPEGGPMKAQAKRVKKAYMADDAFGELME